MPRLTALLHDNAKLYKSACPRCGHPVSSRSLLGHYEGVADHTRTTVDQVLEGAGYRIIAARALVPEKEP